MTIATWVLGILGIALAGLPLAIEIPLGLGPFVALIGGGVAVAALVLGLMALFLRWRSRRREQGDPRPARPLGRVAIGLALAAAGVALSLVVERLLVARDAAAAAEAARKAPPPEADDAFEKELKDNLNR